MTCRESVQPAPQIRERAALGVTWEIGRYIRVAAARAGLSELVRPLLRPWHPAISRAFGDSVIVAAASMVMSARESD